MAGRRLRHDPALAREVHRAYVELYGGVGSYNYWLKAYVEPLARAAGVELPLSPGRRRRTTAVTFKLPVEVKAVLEDAARALGVSKSEPLRAAVLLLLSLLGYKLVDSHP